MSADGAPLRVAHVVDVPVDDLAPAGDGPRQAVAEDLRWVYGTDVPTDWLADGPGRDYPTMIRTARDALAARGALGDVRVVVLAVTTPDLQHERLLGGFVSDLFADRPFTFSVTEQGVAGPFTALRLAHEQLVMTGGSALVLVLEQCTLPDPGTVRLPARDRVVALVVGHGVAGRPVEELTVRRAPRGDVAAAVARATAEYARHPGERTPDGASGPVGAPTGLRVLGAEVDPADDGDDSPDGVGPTSVVRADPGAATTGVWEVLAAREADAPDVPLVVHERCHGLGYRCTLRLGPRVGHPDAGTRTTAERPVVEAVPA
ncbi:hypothetical protein [Cellulosimicrobium marinum]|uniref:hypothetical protein n=1 Tax=Cellulosimicrobium marinum TaxID=1638992 RepID=UPI001E5B33AB|nr:hypothetical protein [Cellulosimicrobium marinum]MCB7135522.1 hypothetical protein [Cellulosimicrobium marinum]